jgi:hypothetical protein
MNLQLEMWTTIETRPMLLLKWDTWFVHMCIYMFEFCKKNNQMYFQNVNMHLIVQYTLCMSSMEIWTYDLMAKACPIVTSQKYSPRSQTKQCLTQHKVKESQSLKKATKIWQHLTKGIQNYVIDITEGRSNESCGKSIPKILFHEGP